MSDSSYFHISDILSIITGRPLSLPECTPYGSEGGTFSPRRSSAEGPLQLAEYMTGVRATRLANTPMVASIIKYDYPDKAEVSALNNAARGALLKRHGWLSDIEVPEFDGDDRGVELRKWIKGIEDEYGAYHKVEPLEKRHGSAIWVRARQRELEERRKQFGPFSPN